MSDFGTGFAFINGELYTDRGDFEQTLRELYQEDERTAEIVLVDNIYTLEVDLAKAVDYGDVERYGEAAFGGRIQDTIRNPDYE